MKRSVRLPFASRVILCMALSLILNAFLGHNLRSSLSEGNYRAVVAVLSPRAGDMQLLYDTGKDFNKGQQVTTSVRKGQNSLEFPFRIPNGGQLRYIRLDFGSDKNLNRMEVHSIALSRDGNALFHLGKEEIPQKLGFLVNISEVDPATATFSFYTDKVPFDPYVVFDPVNELVYPKWQRVCLLVMPWLLLFSLPLLRWLGRLRAEGEWGLLFAGLFIAAIPLKIAWVTFTTLLLLAYALYCFAKNRRLRFGPAPISLLAFFAVSLIFLGAGNTSKLAIPLGLVLFALIGAMTDFSDRTDRIKKIYITVFFVVMSISMVSWLLLMMYDGYYYKIDLASYFSVIKSNAHATMYWLYYPHTTFLSFFILIGGLFCLDLYGIRQISKGFGLLYAAFALCTLMLLGSRFALLLGIALPFVHRVPVKDLSRWLLPVWGVIFLGITYLVGALDVQREQLWKVTWTAFKDKIWMGHGTGTSSSVLPDHLLIDKAGVETLMEVNHSHNQFLTYLLENGILGTLLFLGAFLLLFHQFAKRTDKTMVLISFMILLLMIIESPFRTTTSLYVIAFLLAIVSQESILKSGQSSFS